MKHGPSVRDTYKYKQYMKRQRVKVIRDNDPIICTHCQQAIDPALDYFDGEALTLNHITPLAVGGDPFGEVEPQHRRCNTSLWNQQYGPKKGQAQGSQYGMLIYEQYRAEGHWQHYDNGKVVLNGIVLDDDEANALNKALCTRQW